MGASQIKRVSYRKNMAAGAAFHSQRVQDEDFKKTPLNIRGIPTMRVFAAAIVAGSLALATVAATVVSTVALAQSTSAPAPTGSSAAAPAGPATTAAPAPSGKKLACQAASEAVKGQARKDQMQLCMMQARLDCLKQAIDQNIVGPQRADFVKSCAG
jgi:hypothetical protein